MATSCEVLADCTVAATPLNDTVLFDDAVSKFAPLMVTKVPGPPFVGVKLVMVGAGAAGRTVKLLVLVLLVQLAEENTVIGPVVAVGGMVTVS
jgi:hypothetical protein